MSLSEAISRVVEAGNCSGCGACALLSDDIRMDLSSEGHLRPVLPVRSEAKDSVPTTLFLAICPGVRDEPPASPPEARRDVTWGNIVGVYEGQAEDLHERHNGASAGVIGALARWLVSTRECQRVFAVVAKGNSLTSEAKVVRASSEIPTTQGSRYQPASSIQMAKDYQEGDLVIGKPCEISALRRHSLQTGRAAPLLISFFCGGTPSQLGTTRIVAAMGLEPTEAIAIRFRGHGWPGPTTVVTRSGTEHRMEYEKSWGDVLNRHLQWRCKICPDGIGEHADIVVADYWRLDEDNQVTFEESNARSIVIARTVRGQDLLDRAKSLRILSLRPESVDNVATVQEHHQSRRDFLAGRLIGRKLAGGLVPQYRGYSLLRRGLYSPRRMVGAAIGAFRRTIERDGQLDE